VDVHKADWRARRWAVALVASGTVGGAIALAELDSALTALQGWITREPASMNGRLSITLAGSAFVLLAPLLLVAGYLWRLGARVVQIECYPTPEMKTLHDTVVIRGAAARSRGRTLQLLAAVLAACAIGLAVAMWRLGATF